MKWEKNLGKMFHLLCKLLKKYSLNNQKKLTLDNYYYLKYINS